MNPEAAGTAVLDGSGSLSYADLAADALGLRDQVERGGAAAIVAGNARLVAAAITALDGWAAEVRLVSDVDQDLPLSATRLYDRRATVEARGHPHGADAATSTTRWRLYSSGTTGAPKAVDHTLASLSRTMKPGGLRPRRWGLLYEATRMAGIQVVIQSLSEGSTLVDATALSDTTERLSMLVGQGVDALSATPSVWRQILQFPGASGMRLDQITLGGEIADQLLLDALQKAFPSARISHVYASTETGAAFTVSDGREGFPASYLHDSPGGIELDVRDDVLYVRSPSTSAAGTDGFVRTGDVVRIRGGRVRFQGRDSGMVNVGGEKVWPEQVERTLRDHPDVFETVVEARRNPLSGWVLTAAVVAASDADTHTLPARLRAHCGLHLAPAQVPALIRVVPTLRTAVSGKMERRR